MNKNFSHMFGENVGLCPPRQCLHGIDESDSCGEAPQSAKMSGKLVVAAKDGVKL